MPSYLRPIKNAAKVCLRKFRLPPGDRLFWSRYEPRNFGDWIGPYLYKTIVGREPIYTQPSDLSLRGVYATVGSILRHIRESVIVWGSGIISAKDHFPEPQKTVAVRGPRTHARYRELGYVCPSVYGDPAILLPKYYKPSDPDTRWKVGVVPHFVDWDIVHPGFRGTEEIRVIDVTLPVEEVIDSIVACDGIVSSSLHGLIVAQAYDVPAAWVEFSDKLDGDGTKFHDYLEAGEVYSVKGPERIPSYREVNALKELIDSAPQPNLLPLRKELIKSCPFAPALSRGET